MTLSNKIKQLIHSDISILPTKCLVRSLHTETNATYGCDEFADRKIRYNESRAVGSEKIFELHSTPNFIQSGVPIALLALQEYRYLKQISLIDFQEFSVFHRGQVVQLYITGNFI